jgi:hypothetical protein
MNTQQPISKPRLIFGGSVIVLGLLSPLLIPFVASLPWSIGVKSAISGLLALGIPELFMIIGVAIMGKDGYQIIKEKLFVFLKQFAPPDYVSLARYRIGLILFILPLFAGWMLPYLIHYVPGLKVIPLWTYILGDALFISSLFLLGGHFWDKLSRLFIYDQNKETD